jgi:HK97 family phage major capsid protein
MTSTVIPTSAAELEEMLGDDGKLKAIFDGGDLGEFVKNYATAVAEKDAALGLQVQEQVQATLAEFLKDQPVTNRPDLRPDSPVARNRGQHHNRHAPGAQLDGKFESTGDLLKALFDERKGDRPAAERLGQIRNDYSTTIPSEGGFLVPEEFRAELLRVALESAIVRPRARVIPMATPRIKFPMIDAQSNASSVYGGVVGYWTEEAAALVASSAKFGSVTLDAQKLTGYAEIPNELLADSAVSVSAFVDQLFPEALAWFEDVAFMRGSGVGEPLGFLNAGNTARVAVAKEAGQAAGSIVWENIVKMYARMLPSALANAVWIANIDTFPELATMALSVGTGGSAVWLGSGVDGPPMTILGRPVIFTEKAETLGLAGDINFVDLGYYLIGDRQSMTAMTSEHFKFNVDSTAYRIIERVDGRPWIKNAITPNKGAGTLSPFVQLATRA